MRRLLHVIAGPDQGHQFLVSDTFTTMLGRSRHANTQLKDLSVSRVHCEIEIRSKRIFLTDLDSASGTYLNGKRVGECLVKDGDLIKIGATEMRVVNPDAQQQDSALEATIPPPENIPDRPVLMTPEKLPGLTGHRLSHYTVGEMLARGQTGLVFEATDFRNDRQVALKVLWPEFTQNEDDMQRFVRAMKTMMPLNHPNLVRLYGAGKTGPYCWIAMELAEGESLTKIIQRIGTANMLDWRRVMKIGYYLAKALDYAHGQGIVHRNLTPQNVMVGPNAETTKLGDLMLAKAQEGGLAQQITKPGELIGDLRYMAPERTGGNPKVDPRSDLYSLGALMYAMATGRPPIESGNVLDTIKKIHSDKPIPPKKFQMAIPDLFEGMILTLLAKHADARPESAAALIKEFERVAKYTNMTL